MESSHLVAQCRPISLRGHLDARKPQIVRGLEPTSAKGGAYMTAYRSRIPVSRLSAQQFFAGPAVRFHLANDHVVVDAAQALMSSSWVGRPPSCQIQVGCGRGLRLAAKVLLYGSGFANGGVLQDSFLPPLLLAGGDHAVDGVGRVPTPLNHGIPEHFLEPQQSVCIGHLQNVDNLL